VNNRSPKIGVKWSTSTQPPLLRFYPVLLYGTKNPDRSSGRERTTFVDSNPTPLLLRLKNESRDPLLEAISRLGFEPIKLLAL
jgi:hypothetical protein